VQLSISGKKVAHLAEYAAVRVAVAVLGLFGERIASGLGSALGGFIWNVVGIRRKLVIESLQKSFPQAGSDELNRLGHKCYRNLGAVFVEIFRIHRLSNKELAEKVVFRNREILEDALAEGRGVVNVAFHYGNWELMGARAAREGWPLDVIARPQTNPLFNSYVNAKRESNGMRLVHVRGSSGRIAKALRGGRIVTFLADQDAHQVGVFVPFLGRQASTPIGPALFTWKIGSPMVISLMLPLGDGRWEVVFERVPRPESEDRDEFIRELTEYYTRHLEQQVRKAPEHWFWPHKRWKTRQR
jgi:Kdo2-lipid IVA lauroyltransferase/acyltransferase